MLTYKKRRMIQVALWAGVVVLIATAFAKLEPWIVFAIVVVGASAAALVRSRAVVRFASTVSARDIAGLGFQIWVPLTACLVLWFHQAAGAGVLASGLLAAALLLAQLVLAFVGRNSLRTLPYVINLPGVRGDETREGPDLLRQGVALLAAAAALVVVMPLFVPAAWTTFLACVIVIALMLLLLTPMVIHGIHVVRTSKQLKTVRPVFALLHDRQSTVVSHFNMWQNYFEKAGHPYVQIVANKEALDALAKSGSTVVGLAPRDGKEASVAHIIPKSVRVLFYMRNGELNRAMVEARPDLTHVFLHHGDGDKPANSRPSHGLHDHILVAGQAAIDRYARRGVSIPVEKFRIMGRPQASGFREADGQRSAQDRLTVLYAPTWKGMSEKVNFSSLLVGPEIVERLVARGCRVIFRPHHLRQDYPPHAQAIRRIKEILATSKKHSGIEHLWGDSVEHDLTLADVANLSDAMIADVSGVVTDYRQSGKPFAMVSTKMPIEEFRLEYPSSKSAYVIDAADVDSIDRALDDMLGTDSLKDVRLDDRDYYLGGFRGQGSPEAFLAYLDELAADR